MKLLASSADCGDLACIVERLMCAHIPCAVAKGVLKNQISVWVQRDRDFSLAVYAVVNRPGRPRLPHWGNLLATAPLRLKSAAPPEATPADPPQTSIAHSASQAQTTTAVTLTSSRTVQEALPAGPPPESWRGAAAMEAATAHSNVWACFQSSLATSWR